MGTSDRKSVANMWGKRNMVQRAIQYLGQRGFVCGYLNEPSRSAVRRLGYAGVVTVSGPARRESYRVRVANKRTFDRFFTNQPDGLLMQLDHRLPTDRSWEFVLAQLMGMLALGHLKESGGIEDFRVMCAESRGTRGTAAMFLVTFTREGDIHARQVAVVWPRMGDFAAVGDDMRSIGNTVYVACATAPGKVFSRLIGDISAALRR